ncbi:MAG: RNA methyltransferase [Candidatus Magasanikbacteria bacterium]|nr:RNA methyltransferase [Candidatus Magasanikbacteria bacterium]
MIKSIKKLQQKKYRKEYQQFFVEGVKGVTDLLNSSYEAAAVCIESGREKDEDIIAIIDIAKEKKVPVQVLPGKDIKQIKSTDTFPGVMGIANMKEKQGLGEGHVICLDGVMDPGNLGTIIRTADWFGITNIVLSENCVDPYNPKVVRSTMGSLFHVQLIRDDLETRIGELKEKGYKTIGLTLDGESLDKLPEGLLCLVLGSESHGVSKEVKPLLDASYTIPGKGEAESLNVAVAGGIVMSKL